uniref:Uncharacterized protein n=1 Tax=Coptotermes formosanus TaxID=36987 RepID=R4UMD1_COPFO|nr:hypothetical protein [Coptotermes formosanus]
MKSLPVCGASYVMGMKVLSHRAFVMTAVSTVIRNTHLRVSSVAVLMLVVQHPSWYHPLDTCCFVIGLNFSYIGLCQGLFNSKLPQSCGVT